MIFSLCGCLKRTSEREKKNSSLKLQPHHFYHIVVTFETTYFVDFPTTTTKNVLWLWLWLLRERAQGVGEIVGMLRVHTPDGIARPHAMVRLRRRLLVCLLSLSLSLSCSSFWKFRNVSRDVSLCYYYILFGNAFGNLDSINTKNNAITLRQQRALFL